MPRYERVRYRAEQHTRSVLLEHCTERAMLGFAVLVGNEVSRDGSPRDRIHMIETAMIVDRSPLTMDLHYGELVEAGG